MTPSPTGDQRGDLKAALARVRDLLGDRPQLALAQAREILKVIPDQVDAQFLSAAALRRCGDAAGALAQLAALAAAHAEAWALHLEIGVAEAALGRTAAAIVALRRATELNPASALAWHSLGDQLAITGELAAAEDAHARTPPGSVHDPDLQAAVAALLDGRGEAALPLGRRFNLHPTDVAAVRLIAHVAAGLGREAEIEALLVEALERAPDFAPARQQLVVLLHHQNRDFEALAHVDRLVAAAPEAQGFRGLRMVVRIQLGDFAGAIADCEILMAAQPDQAPLWLTYGNSLKTVGRQAEAIAAFRRSLVLAPSLGEAYWSLANLKTVRLGDEDIAAMRAQLAGASAGAEDRIHLHFALGKALEDAGDYRASFEHYAQGNGLRRRDLPYDADGNTGFVRRSMATFSADLLARRAGQGCPSPDPIFVLGLPRSGSTLIEQILASHSQVEGTKELPDLVAMARRLAGRPVEGNAPAYPGLLADLPPDELARLGEDYLARTRVHRRQGRPFFIDKFPNNFMHVGLIRLILPRARIIDARRNPLACCFSVFKQHFAHGQAYGYDLADLGRYYADYVALMDHFDAIDPGAVHRVRYEAMVADTEGEVRRLLDYCGLDFEPQCLRFHETDRAVQTASSEQVRRPIYTDGLDQWRRYEPWLAPLKQALGPVLASEGL